MRLAALSTYVPDSKLSIETVMQASGKSTTEAGIFSRLFGFKEVAVLPRKSALSDPFDYLIDEISYQAVQKYGSDSSKVDAVLYVHGLPLQYQTNEPLLPGLLARHSLFADVALMYEIDQYNCAGLFWALDIANKLFQNNVAKRIIVLAGDSISKLPLHHRYVPGCSAIGDAFAAMILDDEFQGCQIDQLFLHHQPKFHFGLYGKDSQIKSFYEAHDEFVLQALSAVNYSKITHSALLPHNVNALSWLQFRRRYQWNEDSIRLDLIRNIGHCYTVDPLISLAPFFSKHKKNCKVSMMSVGLGAYIGACNVAFT